MRALVARSLALVAVAAAFAAPSVAHAHVPPAARADTAAPASSARWIGVYRVTFLAAQGDMLDARVLIEPNGAKLVGMLLVDQHASGITDMRVEDDALIATVVTAEGRGTLVMRNGESGVTGTLTIGKRTWQVSGSRAI